MLAAAAITYAGIAVLAFLALTAAGISAARTRTNRDPELQEIPISARVYAGSDTAPMPSRRR